MIRPGRTQLLRILRRTREGLVLGDDDALEVVLHLSEAPRDGSEDGHLRVFVNPNVDGKLTATTRSPKIEAGTFAKLRVVAIRGAGAHVDWGMDTPLLIPHDDQKKPMEEGRWYVMGAYYDKEAKRLHGSTRIEELLDNTEITVKEKDKVDLLVFGKSDLGLSVIVNNTHQGLVHANDVFKPVTVGDRLIGFVKTVRPDNKLDIVLQPIGYRQYIDAHTTLLAKRLEAKGYLALTDKSSAEEIYEEFGISKKAFKKALGALYKERLVRIGEDGVVWMG
ncbi:MAG: GntR family transcriptional regulator [Flavobacteriales bacterium]|nr:GntR family transcriptional regulator [Flavobacteriales bacterium]